MNGPLLSVVVVMYNMRRQGLRTLETLSPRCQRDVRTDDYEVVAVDNGSSNPLEREQVLAMGSNFRYVEMGDRALPSPCSAINAAIEECSGEYVGILIDGARMASPGLISRAMEALRLDRRAVVATLAWHLGPEPQYRSIPKGYCEQVEEELLTSVEWRRDGYELFSISSFAGSSENGYFQPIAESNAIFMQKALYKELGGFDCAFDLPGGGFANLDFYKRACEAPEVRLVMLLGEGTFHQVHGGVATNALNSDYVQSAASQYRALRGRPFIAPVVAPLFYGYVSEQARPWIR